MPALKAAPADQLVAAAAQQFHAGRLAEAESLLRQLLASQPRHAVALHLLGAIAYLSDQHERRSIWSAGPSRRTPGMPPPIPALATC